MSLVTVTLAFDTPDSAAAFLQGLVGKPAAVVAAEAATEKAPKAPRTRTAPAAPAAAPAAPVAAPAPAAAPAPEGEALKKQAIATLVKLINANDALGRNGKQVCTDLCLKFGGANISKIDPARYPAVIAEVEKELEALNSDPTA